jgi:hypothetical protein
MLEQEESLLAAIALRLAKSPEDVATEGLAYVLSRSDAARGAIQSLVNDWAPDSKRQIVSFRSQVGRDDDSRPDIEAQDSEGAPVVIFENKFWAGLTDAQPVSYLMRLQAHGGILCFVAPASRIQYLWPEVVARAAAAFGDLPLLRNEPQLKLARVGEPRFMALTSWTLLLNQLRSAVETHGDSSLAADVRQLIGLAAKMDVSGFIPFSVADLTAPTARQVLQYCEVVNALVEDILREPIASKKGLKASAGQGWYGHYLWLRGHGCQLSFNAPMWAEYGQSPLWLRVASPNWKYSDVVERSLAERLGNSNCVVFQDGYRDGVWTHLRIPEGCELDAIVGHLRLRLMDIANALPDAAPTGTVTPPVAEPALKPITA